MAVVFLQVLCTEGMVSLLYQSDHQETDHKFLLGQPGSGNLIQQDLKGSQNLGFKIDNKGLGLRGLDSQYRMDKIRFTESLIT